MTAPDWRWLGAEGGEMARRIRELDWSATPVGPVESWPASLRSIIGMMLHARHPMFLWWGSELVQFYNDGYIPSFGVGRHPWALGQPGRTCWAEIWPIIGPEIEGVIATSIATHHEDSLVPIFRNGRMEEVYWTYGYSPVFDASGVVAGVLVVVTETTTRVIAVRRLQTLRALADEIKLSTDRDQLVRDSVRVLGASTEDVPWMLAYRVQDGAAVVLAATNIDDATAAIVCARARAHIDDEPTVIDLADLNLSGGAWPEASTRAIAIAIRTEHSHEWSVLVVGQSPRRPIDDAALAHVRGIARQLAMAATRIDSHRGQVAAEMSRKDLLLQAPFAAALLVGPTWRFTLANELYERMVGRSVTGRDWRACFPELSGSPIEASLGRVFRDGEAYAAVEQVVPLARADGVVEQRLFDFNIVPIRGVTGAVEAMMVVAIEVSAKVETRRELEAALRAKDEFLAMMGHELRNPLAPIVTALALIRSRGAATSEHAIIERQVSHMTRLVDDLLDISRVTQGKLELRRTTSDVSTLASFAREVASGLCEERDHVLEVAVAPHLWWHGDRTRLEQILANLLTNAARYTEPGGRIDLTVDRDGDALVVRVRDNGRGIDPGLLDKLFLPFVQSDRGADRREGGLGLGLAIVKGLVTAHGGTVVAHSAGIGQGSEFVVRIPGLVPEPVAAASEPTPAPAPARSTRVLMVDDNEDAVTLAAEVLRMAGHEVTIANDGTTALSLAPTFDPEVAILDIGLPAMDGYELVQRLRDQARNPCRYIALTGYGRAEDLRRATAAGFETLLVKPVSIKALLAVIAASRST